MCDLISLQLVQFHRSTSSSRHTWSSTIRFLIWKSTTALSTMPHQSPRLELRQPVDDEFLSLSSYLTLTSSSSSSSSSSCINPSLYTAPDWKLTVSDATGRSDGCQQVVQLSQRDRAVGWVDYGQKWKTGTGRQYFTGITSSTTVT